MKAKKNGITRNQDARCPVRNAEKCSLIKPHSSKAGRNSEMLSITRRKKNLQLLTDLCLVLPWTLSLISFQAQWLAGFSWPCLLGGGGTILSLILSTFIFSSVSMEFLAVGILLLPILVHLLSIRLKPLKCVASRFLIVFLEACSLKVFTSGTCPLSKKYMTWKDRMNQQSPPVTQWAGKHWSAEGQQCPTSHWLWDHYGPATWTEPLHSSIPTT